MVMLYGHHAIIPLPSIQVCLGQFSKAKAVNFSRAPKHQLKEDRRT
jgi:hypothetical protein